MDHNHSVGLADRDYMKGERWQREQRQRLAAWHWRNFTPSRLSAPGNHLAKYFAVAVLVGAPAVTIGYAAGADVGPFAPEPVLVWGGEEFDSRADFEAWLRERGGSYEAWALKHPAAAAKLAREP